MARARRGGARTYFTALLRKMLSPGRQARCTLTWTTTWGCLPPGLTGLTGSLRSGHRNGVCGAPRRQNVDVFTYPLLDVLEPQMGDQLLEVLRKIDTRSSHQAIDVPKVFPDSAPLRRVESRPPQLAEQLVEVPPNPGYALAVVALEGVFGARDSAHYCWASGRRERCTCWTEFSREFGAVPQVRREGGGGVQGSLPARRAPA